MKRIFITLVLLFGIVITLKGDSNCNQFKWIYNLYDAINVTNSVEYNYFKEHFENYTLEYDGSSEYEMYSIWNEVDHAHIQVGWDDNHFFLGFYYIEQHEKMKNLFKTIIKGITDEIITDTNDLTTDQIYGDYFVFRRDTSVVESTIILSKEPFWR